MKEREGHQRTPDTQNGTMNVGKTDERQKGLQSQNTKEKAEIQVWMVGIARHRKQLSCSKVLLT
jgi:hypothetical protein